LLHRTLALLPAARELLHRALALLRATRAPPSRASCCCPCRCLLCAPRPSSLLSHAHFLGEDKVGNEKWWESNERNELIRENISDNLIPLLNKIFLDPDVAPNGLKQGMTAIPSCLIPHYPSKQTPPYTSYYNPV
jgi:hypothetical protein